MTAKITRKIVRERVSKSKMKVEGFRWKKAMVYIKLNKHLISNIPVEVKKCMSVRKSMQGTAPGMGKAVDLPKKKDP